MLMSISQSLADLVPLRLRHCLAHPRLRVWLQGYWLIEPSAMITMASRHNLYPDGGSSLVWHFDRELPQLEWRTSTSRSQVQISPSSHALGIRFYPGALYQLLGLNPNEQQAATPMDLPLLAQLQQVLATATTAAARFELVDQTLLRLVSQRQLEPSLIQRAWPQLCDSQHSLEWVIQSSTLGRRQFERRFRIETGWAPAELKRLYRLKRARYLLSQYPQQALAQVAVECGFYDQAHFSRQFQLAVGQSPGQYRQAKITQQYTDPPIMTQKYNPD